MTQLPLLAHLLGISSHFLLLLDPAVVISYMDTCCCSVQCCTSRTSDQLHRFDKTESMLILECLQTLACSRSISLANPVATFTNSPTRSACVNASMLCRTATI